MPAAPGASSNWPPSAPSWHWRATGNWPKGYYLSFGVRTFSSPKTLEALRETPPGQLFLETDDSDTGIEEVYAHAAAVRGTTVEALKRATTENYERIFAPQNG